MSAENMTLLVLLACFAVGAGLVFSGKLMAVLIGFIPFVGASVMLLAYAPSNILPANNNGIAIMLVLAAWGAGLFRSEGNGTSIFGVVVVALCVIVLFGYLDPTTKSILEDVFETSLSTAEQGWSWIADKFPARG